MRIASSARGSQIKLWDVRRLHTPSAINDFAQIYTQHKSHQNILGLDFLNYENYIVSGSDNGFAYIYETNSGRLAHRVSLGFGQVQTGCAIDQASLSFFTTFLGARYLGFVDTEGDDICHEVVSAEQARVMFTKEAWDAALGKHHERILNAIKQLQPSFQIGYENWISVLRASDSPICKELIHDINLQYEEELKALNPESQSFSPQERPETGVLGSSLREEKRMKTDQTQIVVIIKEREVEKPIVERRKFRLLN
jgi:hypothetical protein